MLAALMEEGDLGDLLPELARPTLQGIQDLPEVLLQEETEDPLQAAAVPVGRVQEATPMATVGTSLVAADQDHTLHYPGELAVVAADLGDAVVRV